MEGSIVTTIVLPAALAVIMLSLGLSLTVGDFRRIFTQPRGVFIGILNLCLISPGLAFFVAEIWGLDPLLAVGLVLMGAAPGGTMAALLTHMARGEVALSVSMTAISSVAALFTVPIVLTLGVKHFGATGIDDDVSMTGVVARVFLITLVPLAAGMYLRHRNPERVQEIEPKFKRVALVAFVLVVVGAVISERDKIVDNFADVAGAALTLNVLAMSISYTVALLARLDNKQATAIAMELGVHNSTLAITIGAGIATELAVPGAVYSAFMFITAGAFARLMYLRNVGRGGIGVPQPAEAG